MGQIGSGLRHRNSPYFTPLRVPSVSRCVPEEAVRLTDMTVQKLPTPESGSKVYSDDSLPSFAVRVRNTGTKTFILTIGNRTETTYPRPVRGRDLGAGAREGAQNPRRAGAGHRAQDLPHLQDVLNEYLDRRAAEVRASTRQADSYHFKLCGCWNAAGSTRSARRHSSRHRQGRWSLDQAEHLYPALRALQLRACGLATLSARR